MKGDSKRSVQSFRGGLAADKGKHFSNALLYMTLHYNVVKYTAYCSVVLQNNALHYNAVIYTA